MGGATGDARLTTLTAAVLLVLLAAEGATLLSLQSFLSWHIYLGMLLVPVVGLKLASVGYRFARYYGRSRDYVEAGPPPLLLRLLGPVVVVSTLGLFATGVALAALGPGTSYILLLHKASFVIWVAAMSIHLLGHVLKLPPALAGELRDDGIGGSRLRATLLAGSIVVGAVVALATAPLATQSVQWIDVGN